MEEEGRRKRIDDRGSRIEDGGRGERWRGKRSKFWESLRKTAENEGTVN
jgi:hypothetical protein